MVLPELITPVLVIFYLQKCIFLTESQIEDMFVASSIVLGYFYLQDYLCFQRYLCLTSELTPDQIRHS